MSSNPRSLLLITFESPTFTCCYLVAQAVLSADHPQLKMSYLHLGPARDLIVYKPNVDGGQYHVGLLGLKFLIVGKLRPDENDSDDDRLNNSSKSYPPNRVSRLASTVIPTTAHVDRIVLQQLQLKVTSRIFAIGSFEKEKQRRSFASRSSNHGLFLALWAPFSISGPCWPLVLPLLISLCRFWVLALLGLSWAFSCCSLFLLGPGLLGLLWALFGFLWLSWNLLALSCRPSLVASCLQSKCLPCLSAPLGFSGTLSGLFRVLYPGFFLFWPGLFL